MAEHNRDSSMEEILSSIKRIIAEDKVIDAGGPIAPKKKASKPALKAVPDVLPEVAEEIFELTDELRDDEIDRPSIARGNPAEGDRLIDEKKLDSMRQSLSALVATGKAKRPAPVQATTGTSLEDMTRDMMRPMIKQWLDDNLPTLVEELVAREIQKIGGQ